MREIEFRAWLKGEMKMVEVKTIHFGTRKIMYGYSAGSQNYGNSSCGFDGCEIMQFTGLKDKNGVKVYEGDIVKCKVDIDLIVLVEWSEIMSAFVIREPSKSIRYCDLCFARNIEVIGDIYDNPELIKEGE